MKKLKQFSKKFMYIIAIVWIAGAVYGGFFLIAQLVCQTLCPEAGISIDTTGFWNYLKDPLSCGVISYMAKSAFESCTSMKQKYREDYNTEEFKDG